MYQQALLYLAAVVAGWALTILKPVSFIGADLITFFHVVGVIVIIVFSIAIIWLGIKSIVASIR